MYVESVKMADNGGQEPSGADITHRSYLTDLRYVQELPHWSGDALEILGQFRSSGTRRNGRPIP